MTRLQVLILIGSPNDAPIMQGAVDVLNELGISVEMTVASASSLSVPGPPPIWQVLLRPT
jgi:phosphoribosylcarboxyaminoimidazole (NCAIR) mutase